MKAWSARDSCNSTDFDEYQIQSQYGISFCFVEVALHGHISASKTQRLLQILHITTCRYAERRLVGCLMYPVPRHDLPNLRVLAGTMCPVALPLGAIFC